jgi:hypothetical protein
VYFDREKEEETTARTIAARRSQGASSSTSPVDTNAVLMNVSD